MKKISPYIFEDEPVSSLAVWSAWLAMFALAVAALSVVILRSGALEIVPALATFGAALVFAGLAILTALAAFVTIWRHGYSGLGRAVLGLLFGLALLAYPGYLAVLAYKLPAISDVSTDTGNPPRFEALAPQRPRGRVDYPGAATAALQRAGYSDIGPLQLNVQPRVVFEATQNMLTKRKWLIANSRAPAPRRDGVIEMTVRSAIMGFRDDVVIRIAALGAGSRVDIRSASRVGIHDLGANAARIRGLIDDIEEAANAAPVPKPEPEKPEQPERRPKRQNKS